MSFPDVTLGPAGVAPVSSIPNLTFDQFVALVARQLTDMGWSGIPGPTGPQGPQGPPGEEGGSGDISEHAADTTAVHGIANTALLVVQADLAALATDADLASHAADTTAIHGIADTSVLAVQSDLTPLATDADLATHTGNTANPHAVTKAQVGLANVDNTSDVGKPVSTAQQTALNLKQDAATAATDAELTAHTGNTSNPHAVTKAQVGLANVDNTSDTSKPVSTAQQTALDLKQDAATAATDAELTAHTGNTSNPHSVTKTQVGLANVDNTSDANKPVSTAQQAAIDAAIAAGGVSLTNHANDTTAIHGIADTSLLVVQADLTPLATDADLASESSARSTADTNLTTRVNRIRRFTPSAGEETYDITDATTSRSMGTGQMKTVFFQALVTESINNLMWPIVTAGVAGTLGRAGVFSVNTSDWSITGLLAATANTVAHFHTIGETPRALTTTFNKVEGTWYAIGLLQTAMSTAPGVAAFLLSLASMCGPTHNRPRKGGLVTGLTDLPTSVAAGGYTDDTGIPYILLLP